MIQTMLFVLISLKLLQNPSISRDFAVGSSINNVLSSKLGWLVSVPGMYGT
jgi:hypothetical protein